MVVFYFGTGSSIFNQHRCVTHLYRIFSWRYYNKFV